MLQWLLPSGMTFIVLPGHKAQVKVESLYCPAGHSGKVLTTVQFRIDFLRNKKAEGSMAQLFLCS